MARCTYGSIVTEINGSIGGTTFQKNNYGFTVKNKPNMVRPNSSDQQLIKQRISSVTQTWNQLTSSDHTVWETYANAYPQYSRHNSNAMLGGHAVYLKRQLMIPTGSGFGIDGPNLETTVGRSFIPTLRLFSSLYHITPAADNLVSDIVAVLYMSNCVSQSTVTKDNMCRLITAFDNPNAIRDITSAYKSVFGESWVVGLKCRVIIRTCGENTGMVFADQKFDLTITV
jgi:hypothetical protein